MTIVKDAIDAQSGRFEFFKQSLTLSLAGVAGVAALFTDVTRIPSDVPSKIAICAIGLILLATTAWSIMGISTYANLLKALDEKRDDVKRFQEGMISHARVTFITLGCAGFALLVFALLRLFCTNTVTFGETLESAQQTISSHYKVPIDSLNLDKFDIDQNSLAITYVLKDSTKMYTLISERSTGQVKSIWQSKPASAPETRRDKPGDRCLLFSECCILSSCCLQTEVPQSSCSCTPKKCVKAQPPASLRHVK